MLKFLDLRDTTGRASSVAIVDGTGSGIVAVRIVGVLPHGAEFTLGEFDRFARSYLEARDAMPADPGPLYYVGHEGHGGPFAVFRSAEDASEFIGSDLRRNDPEGVDAGEYYIDGPVPNPEADLDPDDVQGGNGNPIDDALDVLGRNLQCDDNSAHDALDVLRQAFHASLARLAPTAAPQVDSCDLADASVIGRARGEYGSDDVTVDDDAKISRGEYGVWVAAWVYLHNDDDLDDGEVKS